MMPGELFRDRADLLAAVGQITEGWPGPSGVVYAATADGPDTEQ
jgi:hypothetical protein